MVTTVLEVVTGSSLPEPEPSPPEPSDVEVPPSRPDPLDPSPRRAALRGDHPSAGRSALDELDAGGDPLCAYALARG
jgi:hypothetical protein